MTSTIYLLKLKEDKYYIGKNDNIYSGKTKNVNKKILNYFKNNLNEWTTLYEPIDVIDKFNVSSIDEENNILLSFINKFKFDNIRSYLYFDINLNEKIIVDKIKINNDVIIKTLSSIFIKDDFAKNKYDLNYVLNNIFLCFGITTPGKYKLFRSLYLSELITNDDLYKIFNNELEINKLLKLFVKNDIPYFSCDINNETTLHELLKFYDFCNDDKFLYFNVEYTDLAIRNNEININKNINDVNVISTF